MKSYLPLLLFAALLSPIAAKAHRDESRHVCALYNASELNIKQTMKRLEIKPNSYDADYGNIGRILEYCRMYIKGES